MFQTTTFLTTKFICLIIFPIHLEITNKGTHWQRTAKLLKNMLDEMFMGNLQNELSKDDLKNKLPFKDTKHYKCLIGNRNLF